MSAADECGAVSEHGDVCGLPPHDTGLCQSNGPRKHVSSPEKASKPWFWYRDVSPDAPSAGDGSDGNARARVSEAAVAGVEPSRVSR